MNSMSTSAVAAITAPGRRGRGRRPVEQVRPDVLTAAGEILFAQGLTAVTFDRVARLSKVSRTTLYKWWPTPGALAAEAYFFRVEHDLEFVDTGDISADLRRQLRAFARLMTTQPAGTAIRELIGLAQTDIHFRETFPFVYAIPRRAAALKLLSTAQERGDLRQDASLEVIVDQLWGACYHRILLLNEDVTEDLVDAFVDQALRGVSTKLHGPTKSRPSGT